MSLMTTNEDLPPIGSFWRHYKSGALYQVVMYTNQANPSNKYPVTIVYRSVVNGNMWSRPAHDWSRSFHTRQIVE